MFAINVVLLSDHIAKLSSKHLFSLICIAFNLGQ